MILKRPIRIEGDTAFVPLSQGYEAIIDAADADVVSQHNWFILKRRHTIYAVRNRTRAGGKRGLVLMHRVLVGDPGGFMVDHINHNGLDNRRCNLRLATATENIANSRTRRDNSSGMKGVDWRADKGCWRAQITVNGKAKSLGHFASRDEAAAAYRAAAQQHFGQFAATA